MGERERERERARVGEGEKIPEVKYCRSERADSANYHPALSIWMNEALPAYARPIWRAMRVSLIALWGNDNALAYSRFLFHQVTLMQ